MAELGPVPAEEPPRPGPSAPPPPPPPPPKTAAAPAALQMMGGAGGAAVAGELQGFKLKKTSGPAEVDQVAALREGLAAEKAANERLRAVDMERWYTELEQRASAALRQMPR
jgi:hypothetical protein